MAHIGSEVDALREAIDGIEVLGECFETPVDPLGERDRVDVLGPLRDSVRRARVASDRTGASVNPQFPMTADVTPCQHELEPVASQNTCASIWVCPSMNPGVTTWPSASISVEPRSGTVPTSAITPSVTPMSARKDPRPDPSTTVPPRITMSWGMAPRSTWELMNLY